VIILTGGGMSGAGWLPIVDDGDGFKLGNTMTLVTLELLVSLDSGVVFIGTRA